MSDLGPPVDPQVLNLLRRERAAPPGARERVRATLAAAIPGMIAGPHGVSDTRPGHAATAPSAGLGRYAVVASAFLAGGVAGFCVRGATNTPPVEPRVVYVDRAVPTPPPSFSAPSSPASAPSTPDVPTASVVSPHASPIASSGSQLAAERAILDQARSALVQGDPSTAIDRLEQHRRRFLNPLLGEERDAMWVEALAGAGRLPEARARAAAFRRSYPSSLFLPTVESAVAGANP